MQSYSKECNDEFMAELVSKKLHPVLKEVGIDADAPQVKQLIGHVTANHAFRNAAKTLCHYLYLQCIELRGISLSPRKSKEKRLHVGRKNLAIGVAYLKAIIRWVTNEEENHATLKCIFAEAKKMHRVSTYILITSGFVS